MTLHFRLASELWPLVDRTFQRHSREICSLVPSAHVDHVGATAIPGALTKGDLDVLVRVPERFFAEAVGVLRDRYDVAQPHNWTAEYASFAETDDDGLPLGVQLVVEGSATSARFLELRRLLRARPDLVDRTNELKRRHEGGDPAPYSAAKSVLYAEILGQAP